MRRNFRTGVLGAILALGLLAAACGSGENNPPAGDGGEEKPTLTVGSEGFAEAQIVAEMYAQVLENAGYTVERQLTIDTRNIRLPAMEKGDIDIAPEYLASLYSVVDPEAVEKAKPEVLGDPDQVVELLDPLLADMGLTLLPYSDVVDTNALVVTEEFAQGEGLSTTSDLAPVADGLTLGAPVECPDRPFCIPGFKSVYGIEFGDFKALEYGPTITALTGGEIDVGLLYSTDGAIAANNLVVLEDDKNLQAADNITPMVREEILTDEVEELLNSVTDALETDAITELNKRANVDAEDPADLAREFLEDAGLL
jgi:osmoprotectant transport system substrate-binding protein